MVVLDFFLPSTVFGDSGAPLISLAKVNGWRSDSWCVRLKGGLHTTHGSARRGSKKIMAGATWEKHGFPEIKMMDLKICFRSKLGNKWWINSNWMGFQFDGSNLMVSNFVLSVLLLLVRLVKTPISTRSKSWKLRFLTKQIQISDREKPIPNPPANLPHEWVSFTEFPRLCRPSASHRADDHPRWAFTPQCFNSNSWPVNRGPHGSGTPI